MTKKNTILHINNYARLGGIETTVIDMATAFPQFFHVLLTINPNSEDLGFVSFLQNSHIKYMNAGGKVTEKLVKEINPAIIFLHNTKGADLEGEYPFMWLRKYRVIGVHHMATSQLIPADYDWFVSKWIRDKYKKCETRIKDRGVTMPPCVNAAQYIRITRPERKPVVGRIQSGTWSARGKWSDSFYSSLKKLRGCEYLLAGSPIKDDKFQVQPIRPGGMANYLKAIDIFAIWGDTTESWSKVVTEAFLSGLPVVARDHKDGLAEQMRASGCGFLVNTETEFVEKLQMLIDRPDIRESAGVVGRKWALKHASLDRLKRQFSDMFLEWSIA